MRRRSSSSWRRARHERLERSKKGRRLSGPASGGPFYRIAEIYERAWARTVDDTIDLTWTTGRDTRPGRGSLAVAARPCPYWRARSAPDAVVGPRRATGRILGTLHGALFVTLFGLTMRALKAAVTRIERQVRPTARTCARSS
jgi:hypothetical protein